MKLNISQTGVTIIELLVAIAIIAILAVGMFTVGSRVNTQTQEKLTQTTIETLVTALEEYYDFYGKFPFDANENYDQTDLESDLGTVVNGTHIDEYSSSEALYYFLNKTPTSRKIVNSINESWLTNLDEGKDDLIIEIDSKDYPLIRIIDPWGSPFRYTYNKDDNFPVIISFGPDKFSNTDDDITSK